MLYGSRTPPGIIKQGSHCEHIFLPLYCTALNKDHNQILHDFINYAAALVFAILERTLAMLFSAIQA